MLSIPVLWPFQQLGALVVGPIVADRRPRLCGATGSPWPRSSSPPPSWCPNGVVKALVTRERPATSIGPDINVRGDVSLSGESFVSGHAILVAALAGIVTPYLPARWRLGPVGAGRRW